jgi:phosphoribosylformimino-5-aminoimidazole carboxamide ribotide isomerase
MKIFPAIDIRGGKVVRLFQGDYDQETIYSENPREIAESFIGAGASHLHVVDLDGAKDGTLANFDTIETIARDLGMFVEVGGGIRDEERIKAYLDIGVSRVILGTVAQKDPAFVEEMAGKYGESICVGVDARDGKVAVNGWKEITDKDSFELCRELRGMGVGSVIYTDISRDGAGKGTNMEVYRQLAKIDGLKVTASGGISFYEEIEMLKDLVDAAILGKSIYAGTLDLKKCVEIAEG